MFGDVFRYKGDEYVYFVEDVEKSIIYAGKILDGSHTQWIQRLEEQKPNTHQNPTFSYVVLSTDEFESRAVMCARSEQVTSLSTPHGTINDEDKAAIKEEIKNGPSPARIKLLLDLLS